MFVLHTPRLLILLSSSFIFLIPFTKFILSSFIYRDHDPLVLHSFPTRRSSDLAGAGIAFALQEVIVSFAGWIAIQRSEEHTSELQSRFDLVCRPLVEKKKILIASVMVKR